MKHYSPQISTALIGLLCVSSLAVNLHSRAEIRENDGDAKANSVNTRLNAISSNAAADNPPVASETASTPPKNNLISPELAASRSLSASTSANPFRSPAGVVQINIFPMFGDVGVPSMTSCHGVEFDSVSQDSMLWPLAGFVSFGNSVYKSFKAQSSINIRSLRYQDVEAARNLAATQPLEFITSCVARRMILDDMSVSSSVCACLSGQKAEQYCKIVDAYARAVHCHDKMAEKVDKKSICPELLSPSLGVQLSSTCSGWVTGSISSLNLDLYILNASPNRIPDIIEPKVVLPEARAYYLAYKAVEKLTRWSDAHRFCSEDPTHPVLVDVEILPTWHSKMYFTSENPDGRKIPIAVLAQRNRDGAETGAFENIMLVIRDYRTTWEGRLSLTNRLGRKYFSDSTGLVHVGYDVVASPIVASVTAFLDGFFKSSTDLAQPRITVIGNGHFGAGVAAIVSLDLAKTFSKASNLTVQHNLITFEGGPVGDFTFVDELRQRVNVRNINAKHSALRSMPCQTTFGCGKDFNITTGTTGDAIGPFIPLPGRVEADTDDLGAIWGVETNKLEIAANAACAAPCWLSSNFCQDDPSPRCTYQSCGAFFTKEAAATASA